MSKITLAPNAAGTGTFTVAAPATNTDRTLTLPDVGGTLTVQGSTLLYDTAQATTSGTFKDFTAPSWAKRATVMLGGVSTGTGANPGTDLLIQLGTSGGIVSTGYSSAGFSSLGGANNTNRTSTSGFVIFNPNASNPHFGSMVIANLSGNTWTETYSGIANGEFHGSGGGVTLSGAMTTVRITAQNGTAAFNAGTVNVIWEG